MELSSPPSPPPLPSNVAFNEIIHVPHIDNVEPRYCTTIECNNNDDDDGSSNVSNILINSNSENHCAVDNNESKCVNESNACETVTMNGGNTFDFRSIEDDDSNANDQNDMNNGLATVLINQELLVANDGASTVNLLSDQCSLDDSATENNGERIHVAEPTPYTDQSNAGEEEHCANVSSSSHSKEITEHSAGNTSSAIEIVANIPTPSTTCHESTASIHTGDKKFNCDENDPEDVEDEAEADADDDEEEAIFHFLGKANEIVRLYTNIFSVTAVDRVVGGCHCDHL